MAIIYIENATDSRLTVFSKMTDSELRDPKQLVGLARAIGETDANCLAEGLFIAESKNVTARALAYGAQPFALLVEERWLESSRELIDALLAKDAQLPVFVASHELACEITGFERMRGMLTAFKRSPLPNIDTLLAQATRIAILEDITNHTNIGAIFRSAAALGVDAVLVTPQCHDPFYRRAARVSMGTVFQVPWTRIGEDSSDPWTKTGLPLLQKHGFKTVALALFNNSLSLEDPQLQNCEKLALVLGTEGDGLASQTIATCDYTVKIPMDHEVDSLNVAAASAVAFWQLCKLPKIKSGSL